jgi:hypothetical protein
MFVVARITLRATGTDTPACSAISLVVSKSSARFLRNAVAITGLISSRVTRDCVGVIAVFLSFVDASPYLSTPVLFAVLNPRPETHFEHLNNHYFKLLVLSCQPQFVSF